MDTDNSVDTLRIEAALTEAEDICNREGHRLTATRKKVLRMLLETRSPAKAYDLLTALGSEGSSGPPTIYRALKFLVDVGLAHRVESLNSYFVCGHWTRPHAAIFLICDTCKEAQELNSPETVASLEAGAKSKNFSVRTSIIETYGHCERCAQHVH